MQKQTLGHECKLYWMSAGSFASPTWTEITAAKDVSVPLTRAEIECLRRGSGEVFTRGGQIKYGITGTLAYQAGDAASEALRDAIRNGTSIVLAALTGGSATSLSEGPKMKAEVVQFDRGEPIGGAVEIQFGAYPNGEETTVWLEVA